MPIAGPAHGGLMRPKVVIPREGLQLALTMAFWRTMITLRGCRAITVGRSIAVAYSCGWPVIMCDVYALHIHSRFPWALFTQPIPSAMLSP